MKRMKTEEVLRAGAPGLDVLGVPRGFSQGEAEARVERLEEALRRIAYGAFAYGEAGAVSDLRGIAKGALAFPPPAEEE